MYTRDNSFIKQLTLILLAGNQAWLIGGTHDAWLSLFICRQTLLRLLGSFRRHHKTNLHLYDVLIQTQDPCASTNGHFARKSFARDMI